MPEHFRSKSRLISVGVTVNSHLDTFRSRRMDHTVFYEWLVNKQIYTPPCRLDPSLFLYARGAGGSGFNETFSISTGLVTVINGDRSFLSPPLPIISILPGGAGCEVNIFTPNMCGTLLILQDIQSKGMSMSEGKLGTTSLGDAMPLRIDDPRLHNVSISQTTSMPNAVNKIILSFKLNFRLKVLGLPFSVLSSLVKVSLVVNAQATLVRDSLVPLHDEDRQVFSSSSSVRQNNTVLLTDTGDLRVLS